MACTTANRLRSLLTGALLPALLLALLFSSPAAAQQEPPASTVAFLDERPLLITLPADGEEATATVAVLNRRAAPQTITLRVEGLANALGAAPPAALLPPAHMEIEVAPAAVATFTLTFTGRETLAPPYEGRLLAYGSEGDFDRRPITLQAPPTGATPSAGVQALGMLTDLSFRVMKPLLGGAATVTMPLQGLPQAGQAGAVAGPQGDVAPIHWQGDALTIAGLDHAGQYRGKLQLAEDEEVTVTVAVRAHWLWALLALLLGLAVAQAMHDFINSYRPQKDLEARIDRLLRESWEQQEQAVRALPPDWPWSGEVFRLVDQQRKNGLLVQTLTTIRDRFMAANSQAEREEWNIHGKQFERAKAYAAELKSLNDASHKIFVAYTSLKQTILRFEDLPVAQASLATIKPCLLEDAEEMARKQVAVGAAANFLDAFGKLHLTIYQLEQHARDDAHKTRALELRKRLESAAISSPDFLEYLKADAERLAMDIAVAGAQTEGKQGEEPEETAPTGPKFTAYGGISGLDWALLMPRAVGSSLLQGIKEMVPVTPIDELDADAIRRKLQRLDLGYTVLAGLIAVTTGFHLLYLNNATFGSAAEYFGLLLWSTTVGEGLRVARQILPPLLAR